MTDKSFKFEIITPEKVVYTADVEQVIAPGKNGYFGIMYNHIPFLTTLKTGKVTVEIGNDKKYFAISGGFVQVAHNKMILLAETAEEASKIDVDRAQKALERAKKRLESKEPEVNVVRANAALYRAINRIEIASIN